MRSAFGILTVAAFATAGCIGERCGPPTELPAERAHLLRPDSSIFRQTPPDTFLVAMQTSRGEIVIQVVREWSPLGAWRFYNLVRTGFFDGARFYRVLPGFAAQFGASGIPDVEAAWRDKSIPADPIRVSNTRGMVTFAQGEPDSRSTQLFINLRDNPQLDEKNFAPIGRVISGWDAVSSLNGRYGELKPRGDGPLWRCVYTSGNQYLSAKYPDLDSIIRTDVTGVADVADTTAVRPDTARSATSTGPALP
ncbi:MAG TPA: peptidylprolyl isomerase [Longimicrobiales bacterium]